MTEHGQRNALAAMENKGGKMPAFIPQTMEEQHQYAQKLSRSNLVPAAFKGKPDDTLIAMNMGAELGLTPIAALQNIAVINGKPCLYGDGLLAVCRGSGKVADFEETIKDGVATCKITRVDNATPIVRSFSVEDAKRANLWGKSGPWKLYPQRMLQMRARSWALRDGFADCLGGFSSAEEAIDLQVSSKRENLSLQEAIAQHEAKSQAEELPQDQGLEAKFNEPEDATIIEETQPAPATDGELSAVIPDAMNARLRQILTDAEAAHADGQYMMWRKHIGNEAMALMNEYLTDKQKQAILEVLAKWTKEASIAEQEAAR